MLLYVGITNRHKEDNERDERTGKEWEREWGDDQGIKSNRVQKRI